MSNTRIVLIGLLACLAMGVGVLMKERGRAAPPNPADSGAGRPRSGQTTLPDEPRPATAPGAVLPAPVESDLTQHLNLCVAAGTNGQVTEERVSLIRRWAMVHPREAAAWVAALPESPVRVELLSHVAIMWAERDSGAALAWAGRLGAGEGREAALKAVGYEAARTSPTNALKAAEAMDSGAPRNQLILHAVNQWAVAEPWAALEWTQNIKEGGLRDELFAGIATAWAKLDGEAAARLATGTIRADEVARRAVVSVAQRWHRTDPVAARAWIEWIPDAGLRSNCWEAIAPLP